MKWINENLYDSSGDFFGGLVMPETLNWIYYDVIEDIFPLDFVGYSELENYYCNFQIGMTGLFSYLMGYHFGFYPINQKYWETKQTFPQKHNLTG